MQPPFKYNHNDGTIYDSAGNEVLNLNCLIKSKFYELENTPDKYEKAGEFQKRAGTFLEEVLNKNKNLFT